MPFKKVIYNHVFIAIDPHSMGPEKDHTTLNVLWQNNQQTHNWKMAQIKILLE